MSDRRTQASNPTSSAERADPDWPIPVALR